MDDVMTVNKKKSFGDFYDQNLQLILIVSDAMNEVFVLNLI